MIALRKLEQAVANRVQSVIEACDCHSWQLTGRVYSFVGSKPASYVRCSSCGQVGFMFLPSRVVYTWVLQ